MSISLGKALEEVDESPYKTVTGSLLEIIADRIISGTYPPGTQLRQDKLAQDLGTSRSPVREALTQLEGLGLVTNVPRKGKVVSSLSRPQVDEIFELRYLLEGELLRLALPKMTDREFEAARTANEALREHGSSAESVGDWAQLNLEFHIALYRPALRPVWLNLYQQLHSQSFRYRRVQLQHEPEGLADVVAEHNELLRLVEKRKVDEAVASLRAHIYSAHRSVMDFWSVPDSQAVEVTSSKQ